MFGFRKFRMLRLRVSAFGCSWGFGATLSNQGTAKGTTSTHCFSAMCLLYKGTSSLENFGF